MEVGDGEVGDSLGSEPSARSGPGLRVTGTDLAILTAFCRPYLEADGRFVVPAPNNEILRELAQNGVYLEIDALRGHLRNLYARFGVEDGVNPAQKRARLAELVYEHGVIAGWQPRQEGPEISAASASQPGSRARRAPETPRASSVRASLVERPWLAAGAAVLLLAIGGLIGCLADSERPADSAGPAPSAIGKDKKRILKLIRCQPGKFCLGKQGNMSGGSYQSTRGDRDLSDDFFFYYEDPDQNKTLGPVTNNTWSAWNRSHRDVVVYDGPRGTGESACIQRELKINFADHWQDRISSFRFVDRRVCDRYKLLVEAAVR
jgi:hypothetical protein